MARHRLTEDRATADRDQVTVDDVYAGLSEQAEVERIRHGWRYRGRRRAKRSPGARVGRLLGAASAVALLAGCSGAVGPASDMATEVSTDSPNPTTVPSERSVEERAFLDALDDEGFDYADPDAAIESGQWICDQIDAGHTPEGVALDFHDAGADAHEAGYAVGAAVGAFCPEHSSSGVRHG